MRMNIYDEIFWEAGLVFIIVSIATFIMSWKIINIVIHKLTPTEILIQIVQILLIVLVIILIYFYFIFDFI